MFPRLVSQLSLSPSAASHLAFYARRLAQERVTRAFSAAAAVLIVILQLAIIEAPPAPVNAASNNDIIFGGVTGRADLLNRYDGNKSLRELFSYFGINRDDLAKTTLTSINSKDHSLKSLGRIQHLASDQEIDVDHDTYWLRGLYTWDTGSNVQNGSTYGALVGHRASDGGYFAVLMHCGNIVVKSIPSKPKPTPPPTPKPTPPPTPKPTPPPKSLSLVCQSLQGNITSGEAPLTVRFTGLGAATGQTIDDYIFEFGDNNLEHRPTGSAVHVYESPGQFTAHLRLHGSKGKSTVDEDDCSFTVTATAPPAAFSKHKSALNITQAVDATTKPAHADDQIRYTLTTKNVGRIGANYAVSEHIEDVLEYADVTDLGGGKVSNGTIFWPGAALGIGQTLVKSFTVTIKNPIPPTNVGVSDKNSFDLKLDNIYGNAVQIALQPPLAKQVEAATTSLPDTGTPLGTFIVLIVSAIILYFYFRNRQLISEIKLLRGDYQGGPTSVS
jgi:PKD repeat protein